MSTNKSTNLNLHLWEPEDDFLRTEFNENFEKIDEAIQETQNAKPYVLGSTMINGTMVSGTLLVDFGFVPSFVLIGRSSAYLISSGILASIPISGNYTANFTVSGTSLKLSKIDSNISSAIMWYVAFR